MQDIYYAMPKRYDTVEGKPLFGRVEYRDPVTTNLLDTFTYNKSGEYVTTKNPQYTDVYGIVENCFTLNHLTLVCLYSYIGNLSDMSVDEDPNHWVHEYDFFVSFNNEVIEDKNVYEGINDLRDADTDKGTATVVGYWNKFDCQERTYVWDENCVQAEDGGYIIKSNNKTKGRWILVWNQEALPSEIYGVTSANYANMNNLLSYPDTVGTNSIPTAKVIEFTNFRYPSGTNTKLSTNKIVRCSRDCYFGKGNFEVQDVYVDGQYEGADKTLGNFVISSTNDTSKVCISWYSTADQFFNSGANHLIYDYDGGKGSDWNKLSNSCYLSNCTLEYLTDTHTTLNATLTLDNVNLIMSNAFYWGEANTKNIELKNMKVDTRNFRKLHVSQCSNCYIDVIGYERTTTAYDLIYDIDEKSTNHIHVHKGSLVEGDETFEVLDTEWFDSIADGTMNAFMKFHHYASPSIYYAHSNFNNSDFDDVEIIDLNKFDQTLFNATFTDKKKTYNVINAHDIKIRYLISDVAEALNNDFYITFKDCSNLIMDNISIRIAGQVNAKLINSTLHIKNRNEGLPEEYSAVNNLGKSLELIDSIVYDDRAEVWNEEGQYWDAPNPDVGDLIMNHSQLHMKHCGVYDVTGNAYITDSIITSNSTKVQDVRANINVQKNLTVNDSKIKQMNILFTGDKKTAGGFNINMTGNIVDYSIIGCAINTDNSGVVADRYLNRCTIVGNTLINASSISIHHDSTPTKYRIESNAGENRTTNPNHIFYNDTVAGTIASGLYGQRKLEVQKCWLKTYEYEGKYPSGSIYHTTCVGRAEEIIQWLVTHSFFIPSKPSSSTWDQHIDTINSRGFVEVREQVMQAWNNSQDANMVKVDIVIQKK